MLRKETVSPTLLKHLRHLMQLPELQDYRLVGGTALALQIGHRISVDIDLFGNNDSDFMAIEETLKNEFGIAYSFSNFIQGPMGKGICFHLDGIKTDIINWKVKFNHAPTEIENVRLASKADIIGMKLDTFTGSPEYVRYDKKDFTDLASLLDEFSLSDMIEIYKLRHPHVANPDRIVLEGLEYIELADKKPNPKMLNNLNWLGVKNRIQQAVQEYLDRNVDIN